MSVDRVLGYRLVFAAAMFFLLLAAIIVLFVRDKGSDLAQRGEHRRVNIGWRLAFQTGEGKARGFLRFWPFWEHLTRSIWHLQPIPHAPHHLLEVRFKRHTGREIDLPDGTHIGKGDPIIELHFRNQALLEIEDKRAWTYMRLVVQNLHALARWMQKPDFPGDPRAIYGVTLLYRATQRLGFTLRKRPKGLHADLERFFMTGLLVLYHRKGSVRLLQGTTYGTYPQEIWMSREELLRCYGDSSTLFEETS
jgi:hypothetical protein